jgi:hypothetical protein
MPENECKLEEPGETSVHKRIVLDMDVVPSWNEDYTRELMQYVIHNFYAKGTLTEDDQPPRPIEWRPVSYTESRRREGKQ